MPYNGPIYFEAIPCSPSCTGCPSALASSSGLQKCTHPTTVSPNFGEGDFEWMRVDLEARIESLSTCRSRHPSKPKNDVQGPHLAGSRSFEFPSAPVHARALAYRTDGAAEMTPTSHSWNSRSASILRPGRIRERSGSSLVALSSSAAPDASTRLASKPFSTLSPCKRTGDHGRHAANDSIWTWVSGVDRGQQSLLDHSASLPSDSLQVPCDVDMDRDLYSPGVVPSSVNAHSSAAEMSAPGSSRLRSLPGRRFSPSCSTSFTPDRTSEGCLNDWQHVMDEPPSFLSSSPCPSSCSSTMGFASTLPREPSMLDETTYRSVLDRWSESEMWREDDQGLEEPSSGLDADYNANAYPRSAASSPRYFDAEMQHAVLPALLDQQDFSTLMLQSFTLALADAALEETEGFELFSAVAEAQMDDDGMSSMSYPTQCQDFDLSDQWSPPALRSSSSASSLDPFNLDLFSPASEQADPAAVWDAHCSPGGSSDSLGYFSSSPFVGWSSSDTDTKPPLLTLGHIAATAAAPLAEIPLYQPQPIRPIPPIDIPVSLLDESPEGDC